MPKPPAADRPRLTLQDYILFFATHSGSGLTIDLLNQILFMHGFSQCQSNKSVIVDGLSSLDLLRPRRSTVSANVATPAPPPRATAVAAALYTEDVRRDLEDLGWRACPVGSVLSIRVGASASSSVPLAVMPPVSASYAVQRGSPPLPPLPLPPPAAPGVAAKRKRAPRGRGKAATKRRETRMRDLLTLPSVEDMSAQ